MARHVESHTTPKLGHEGMLPKFWLWSGWRILSGRLGRRGVLNAFSLYNKKKKKVIIPLFESSIIMNFNM